MVENIGLTLTIVSGILTIIAVGYPVGRFFYKRHTALSMTTAVKRARTVLEKIQRDGWQPTAVIALGRSGAIWGGWFAGNLGSLPIYVINRHFEVNPSGRRLVLDDCDQVLKQLRKKYGDGARFLVVEGATTTGNAFLDFEACARRSFPTAEHRTASLYVQRGTISVPYYAGDEALAPWPDRFPWHDSPAYKRYLHGNQP